MHSRADDIVRVANELVGMRYRHMGRGKETIDCVGVPLYIGKKLGLMDYDTKAYTSRPDIHTFNRLMQESPVNRIPMADLSHGDMVQISWEKTLPVHVGIIEVDERGDRWVIHAFLPHKKVTRDPVTPKIERSFVAAWRLPE